MARLSAGMLKMRIMVEGRIPTPLMPVRRCNWENAAVVLASDLCFDSGDRVAQQYANAKMHLHWSMPHSQQAAAPHWLDVQYSLLVLVHP